jgi:HK97 family phage prohead protease
MLALPLPPEAVADQDAALAEAVAILGVPALEPSGPPHLTLLYLGDVDTDADIAAKASPILADTPPVAMVGIGLLAFPAREGRTPIVIAYPEGGPLAELNGALLRALAPAVTIEQFPAFRPHVTVGYLPREVTEQEAALLRGSRAGRQAWTASAVEVVAEDVVLATLHLGGERAFSAFPGAGAEIIPAELLPRVERGEDHMRDTVKAATDRADEMRAANVPPEIRALALSLPLTLRGASMSVRPDTPIPAELVTRHLTVTIERAAPAEGEEAATRVRWRFLASEAVEDRMGDIVEQDWDLKEFEANPVLLFAHEGSNFPVGRVEKIAVENGRLFADVVVHDKPVNPRGQLVADLLREGMLNAVSVGFRSGEMVSRRELPPGDKRRADRGYILRKNKLMEISVVPIPALQTALAQRGLGFARDMGEGEDCGPMLPILRAMVEAVASMKPTGNPDEDFAMGMLVTTIARMAVSASYLGSGEDPEMRAFASSHLRASTARVNAIRAWQEKRAGKAAPASEEAPPEVEPPPAEGEDPPVDAPPEEPTMQESAKPDDAAKGVTMPIDDVVLQAAVDRFLDTPAGRALIEKRVEAERLAQPAQAETALDFFARALK